jgi:DNA-directed RNA polymerase specialized sigma24 family protein
VAPLVPSFERQLGELLDPHLWGAISTSPKLVTCGRSALSLNWPGPTLWSNAATIEVAGTIGARRRGSATTTHTAGDSADDETTVNCGIMPAPDLGERFRAGDLAALADVYDVSSTLVHTMALRTLRDRSRAEDVTEQVFRRAWRSRDYFDPEARSVDAWITNIARDVIGDHLRVRGEQLSNRVFDVVVVAGALQQMAPPERDVVSMSFYLGLTHENIADQLGLPLASVGGHLRRGLAQLRRQLEVSDARPP